MEKEECQITITETDEGFRLDIKGKNLGKSLKDLVACCCRGSGEAAGKAESGWCSSGKEDK